MYINNDINVVMIIIMKIILIINIMIIICNINVWN